MLVRSYRLDQAGFGLYSTPGFYGIRPSLNIHLGRRLWVMILARRRG